MTITSYSLATDGPFWSLALQRREGHERGRAGRGPGVCRLGHLVRVETVDARPQLPVFVAELPVGFGEPFESLGEPPRFREGDERHRNGNAREQPLKHQQNAYLIERLATVSTA